MNYKQAIQSILEQAAPQNFGIGTYHGVFTSAGQAPHQWIGTYVMSKTHDGAFGTMIMGNANNNIFTSVWTGSEWYVKIYD